MKRNSWARAAAITTILLAAIIFLVVGSSPAAAQSPWGAGYFPNLPLTTQDGTTVHFYDDVIKGKSVVIDLIYTHCVDSCPLETARLAQVQKLLGDRVGKDIFFYSISIDPANDTPAVLKEYAEKYHIGPGWTFLTGKKEDIDRISKKIGLYSQPDPRDRDGHTPSVLLGNEPSGQWMRQSATDNPRFLANMIGNWLNSWKNAGATGPVKTYAEVPQLDLSDRGKYIFATHCAACHTIGHGDNIGPDLLGVTTLRDHAWLARFIATPDKVLAEKDPIATALFDKYKQVIMPNLRLGNSDLNELLKYLESQSTAHDKDTPDGEKIGAVKTESGKVMR